MSNELAKKYQKKSDKQHVLDNPDTYIGSIEKIVSKNYIFDDNNKKIIEKEISYVPGLYKLFDEGIVNCRDHSIRMEQIKNNKEEINYPVTNINISISDDGIFTLYNDGNGIDVSIHPEYNIWIPELIFGHLRTSTNYDKNEKKIVGGKNGFGFKLVLIWSTWGKIETVDHKTGQKYIQEFYDNLNVIKKPKITKCKSKPYTSVSFKPDFEKLKIYGLDEDFKSLILRRVYDIAAVTDKSIKVQYNSETLTIKNFTNYIDLYIGSKTEIDRIYEQANNRWEYAVCLAPNEEFTQVSFVNGIFTSKGGKHVEYIVNQIIRKISAYIKAKKHIDVKPSSIKEQLMIFVNCTIENPAFDSQTKDYLNTAISNFGSTCEVSDKFIEKLAKMGVMNTACSLTEVKDNKLAKKTDGTKCRNIRNIPKLVDANFAGGTKANQCILILCEGDSAKSGIISGLSREDRNTIGVYPMKGKMFNIRGESITKISDNKEITEIKQILGLEHGKKYDHESIKIKLRYGKLMFMTDQDLDGSHIKGLGINMIDSEWKSLISIPEFIGYMNTPILKATKGKEVKEFYNNGEFEDWKKTNDISKYNIKYYKGLGTSTSKEFKEYFEKKKIVYFNNSKECEDSIDMVFNKKRANDRKEWLSHYDRESYLNTSKSNISYREFINNDLIHFSKYDNDRSIPNLTDGLKISLRKILYSAFKKNLKSEIKVAQFSGYVSEHSGYHHGEASLNGAIVGMAQNFVGSNNINLFEPKGQFGCIDPETPILMWNGNIEKAKNIKVSDKLIGDDGTCRIVSKLTSGIDDMYQIKNGNMDNYIVNSNHILTLYYSGHKSIFWKNSSKSWSMNYFDNNTKTVKNKNIRTDESTRSCHFNKSCLNKEEAYEKILEFSKNIQDNNIFDINVQQYLSLPSSVKKHLKGIINTNVIEWENKDLIIEPYILGLWLGDGMSDCHGFASMDYEIVQSWALWLDTIGCEVCHSKSIPPHENHTFYIRRIGSCKDVTNIAIGNYNNNSNICKGCQSSKYKCKACDWIFEKSINNIICEGINISGNRAVNLNPFKELFKKYNLFKNKHVPKDYIINSKENRLKILAGMIDTDGTLKKQNNSYRYEISQCKERKHIIESFRIIAGSLGFKAKIYNYHNTYTLSITGDNIHEIPVKLPRKQIINQKRIKNSHKIHNIEINYIGKGPFCGWNIDKNERFLLGDFTITHNTRIMGGKDSASERYIFTNLNPITRIIYPEIDDNILHYLDDDGSFVEPIYYLPIIPMILVNGTKGIGTGFSTDIMSYNPLQIINYLEGLLNNFDEVKQKTLTIHPYYKGFKGKIIPCDTNNKKYLIKGCYEVISKDKIRITELPIGSWTQDYKEFLESLLTLSKDKDKDKDKTKSKKTSEILIKDYNDMSTDINVEFEVTFVPGGFSKLIMQKHENGIDGIEKYLKLITTQSTTNMHLFNEKEQLRKYEDVYQIINEYYSIRYEYYNKRKQYLIDKLSKELIILSNKAKYIQDTLDDKIDLRKKSREQIDKMLETMKFDKHVVDNNYNYLIKMPMDSVSKENVEKLMKEHGEKQAELESVKSSSVEQMWLKELCNLKKHM